jgi:hypothetical protein
MPALEPTTELWYVRWMKSLEMKARISVRPKRKSQGQLSELSHPDHVPPLRSQLRSVDEWIL